MVVLETPSEDLLNVKAELARKLEACSLFSEEPFARNAEPNESDDDDRPFGFQDDPFSSPEQNGSPCSSP